MHSSWKNLKANIRRFDLFGQKVNLLVQKSDTYNTTFGTIISLWIFGFTIMSFL